MSASFDFIAITGIMRFINLSASGDTQKESKAPRSYEDSSEDEHSSEHENSYEDEDLSEDEDSSKHGPANESFLFPSTALPSSSARNFPFRWRGEETGEGEIQLYSNEKVCSITFESPNAFFGGFISDLTGEDEIEFKGIRQGPKTEREGRWPQERRGNAELPNPSYAWRERNEAAYERARVGRWR